MAISDIPEYIKAEPGELVRAGDWNGVQQNMRNSLRRHRHTRPNGTAIDDTATIDEASQIGTEEIVDGAVTAAKLANGAISTSSIPDGAITTDKIANGTVTSAKMASSSVGTAHLQDHAVTVAKLSFQTVNSGSTNLTGGASTEMAVQLSAPSTKTTVYFPTLAIIGSSGNGISDVSASIVYRQAVGANTIDVYIRLTNQGAATAGIIWQVLTFAS